jgi:hypothetical protein
VVMRDMGMVIKVTVMKIKRVVGSDPVDLDEDDPTRIMTP